MWKIHEGQHHVTKELVSVWVCDKKALLPDKSQHKTHHAALVDILKHGPTQARPRGM